MTGNSENFRKFITTHDKNRVDFHNFIKKVSIEDKEQKDKNTKPSD